MVSSTYQINSLNVYLVTIYYNFSLKRISLKHIKNGGAVLRKIIKLKFCLKICPVSLTSHLHMRAQPYAYKDG